MTVAFTLDDAATLQRLNALRAASADLSKPMDALGGTLVTEVALGFRDSKDPWGTAWAGLAKSTIRRRRKKSDTPLRDSGLMANTATHNSGVSFLELVVGRSDRPALIHQFGGMAGRNRAAKIPARPMMPIRSGGQVELPQAWQDSIAEVLDAHLSAAAQ